MPVASASRRKFARVRGPFDGRRVGLLTVPASGCFRLAPGWPTTVMVIGTCVLAAIGFTVAGLWFAIERSPADEGVRQLLDVARTLSNVFLFGFLGSQLGYSYLRGIQPPR